jgi:rhodanese-related sulfurtransferase
MSQLIDFALRHPILVGGSIVAVVATVANEVRLRSHAGVSVSTQSAVRLINQGATVVDLRDAARFNTAHIMDAINLAADELTKNAESRLKKKKPVLLVCDNGTASARFVGSLRKAGFENTWALEGGQAAWERENLPVVAGQAKT